MQVFGTLKLSVVLLGPSWLLWGRSGPKKASQNRSPDGSKMGHLGCHRPGANPAGALLEALVSKIAPRWLQDSSRWPQVVQDSLLGAFFGLQTLSWKALEPQKTVKTNGLTLALPLLCLCFALVSPLLYLPFSFSFRMAGLPLAIASQLL